MTNPKPVNQSLPELEKNKEPAASKMDTDALTSAAPVKLSPEQQMALFEQSLKESDWGHQPC